MHLLYNPITERQVAQLRARLPHALLITGASGAGLSSTARDIAGNDISYLIEPLTRDGEHSSTEGIISVQHIRELYDATKGKSTKKNVIIIDDAERMNETAQNAFLKLLEEPTESTHFILTTHAPEQLLPTIISRTQRLAIRTISDEQTESLLEQIKDQKKKTQINFLADGLPAEIHRLLHDERYFEQQSQLIRDAHTLIGGDRYARISKVFAYASNRDQALKLLSTAKTLLKRSLSQNPTKETIMRADMLAETIRRINGQANVRIQLLRLVL